MLSRDIYIATRTHMPVIQPSPLSLTYLIQMSETNIKNRQ